MLQALPKVRPDWIWVVFLLPRSHRMFDDPVVPQNVWLEYISSAKTYWGRVRWLRSDLPKLFRQYAANVLFCFANVGVADRQIPQVVYLHQALIFNPWHFGVRHLVTCIRLIVLRRLVMKGVSNSARVVVQTDDMRKRLEEIVPNVKG